MGWKKKSLKILIILIKFLDSSWVIIGVAKISGLKNDRGDFYRAPKFDFLKILKIFFVEIVLKPNE